MSKIAQSKSLQKLKYRIEVSSKLNTNNSVYEKEKYSTVEKDREMFKDRMVSNE